MLEIAHMRQPHEVGLALAVGLVSTVVAEDLRARLQAERARLLDVGAREGQERDLRDARACRHAQCGGRLLLQHGRSVQHRQRLDATDRAQSQTFFLQNNKTLYMAVFPPSVKK